MIDFLRSNISTKISSKIYLWFVLSWLSIVKPSFHSVFATPKHLAKQLPNNSVDKFFRNILMFYTEKMCTFVRNKGNDDLRVTQKNL